jgi:hypothetical protein
MPANFPVSAPNCKTDFDSATDVASSYQNEQGQEINAIAAKVGTGDSTPASGKIFHGNGTGTSAWDLSLDTDGTLTANSDTSIPSQKAIKTYADTKIAKTTNITALNETGIADGELAVFNLTNKDIRTSNVTIATTLGADDTTLPTSLAVKTVTDAKLANVVEDTTPQLGGDLDLNGKNIDFPTTANISDCLDEDTMASDSATKLATQQSIKAYADSKISNSLVDAKGDLITASADNTPARLAVGSDGQVPRANSAATNGIDWADPLNSLARQAIINGNFDVWQRGVTGSNGGLGLFIADRWSSRATGDTATTARTTFTVGQTDVPSNPIYYATITNTHSDGANNFCFIDQKIENVARFSGQNMTLSFYAKADAGKDIAIEFRQNFGSGGSADVASIGVVKKTLTTSWAKYTVTVAIPSVSGKTIGAGSYLRLLFWFSAGSTFDVNTDTLGQQDGTFDISEVQLCAGDVALPFMPKSYGEELRACQRYCIVYNSVGSSQAMYATGYWISTTGFRALIHLPVEMRTIPTLTASAYDTFRVWNGGTYIYLTDSPTINAASNKVIKLTVTVASGGTDGNAGALDSPTVETSYLILTAEL